MQQVEKVLHHLLEMVGKMFRRVAISFGAVFVATAAIVEGAGFFLNNYKFDNSLVHVVAVIVGFSFALNVALAVMIEEGLRGFLALIRELTKDAEKLVERVGGAALKEGQQIVHFAEHEAGQLASGAGRLVQSVEKGASTALRGAEQLPGHLASGVQGLERRITGQNDAPPTNQ